MRDKRTPKDVCGEAKLWISFRLTCDQAFFFFFFPRADEARGKKNRERA